MSKDKKNDSGIDPKNTDKNGRDELGKFTTGNDGKPRGATNKTTRDLRLFITGFLNEKAHEIPTLWDTLEDKDKLSLFMHLCRLVLPKVNEDNEREDNNQLKQPVWMVVDNSVKIPNLPDIGNRKNPELITGMEIIDSGTPQLTQPQIDKLIDKL
jgi:hypothetical protein